MTTTHKIYIVAAVGLIGALLLVSLWSAHRMSRMERNSKQARAAAEKMEAAGIEAELRAAEHRKKIEYLEDELSAIRLIAAKQMKNLRSSRSIPTMLVSMLAVLVLSSELRSQPPNSAANSPSSAIRANSAAKGVVNACAAAVEDLAATRKLADALERENAALREGFETARQVEALLSELNASRRNENEALLAALKAKNETIAAKDHAFAKQDEQIAELKRKRTSPLKRLGDILIGVAVTAILK